MLKLNEQVCSLELSKKLKLLNVKQESLFYWVKGRMDYGYEGEWSIGESDSWFLFDHIVNCKIDRSDLQLDIKSWKDESNEEFIKWERRKKRAENKFLKENIVSAFTVAELGGLLPGNLDGCYFTSQKGLAGNTYFIIMRDMQKDGAKKEFQDKSEANARAKMLIYLLEKKLIKVN